MNKHKINFQTIVGSKRVYNCNGCGDRFTSQKGNQHYCAECFKKGKK